MVRPAGSTIFLAQLFAVSGVLHLVRPQIFEPIVPAGFPPRETVIISGLAELVCAAGLLHPATRRAAGAASAALLVAVWPANLKMALDAQQSPSRLKRYGTLARLPLQVPLIRIAQKAATDNG